MLGLLSRVTQSLAGEDGLRRRVLQAIPSRPDDPFGDNDVDHPAGTHADREAAIIQ